MAVGLNFWSDNDYGLSLAEVAVLDLLDANLYVLLVLEIFYQCVDM
jgi:hypothetical protein